ncbi:MAG: SUF system NifU family Fe-S cluster assembly protein [Alphaproteobacteria bacterium]|nr:SUF system NifU family Fe-S cluster assembly protein [Alphaproteobacteria bacterium]
MQDSLRELYQEVILDHGRHPRNFRAVPQAPNQAKGNNPMCGDRIQVYLTLDADGHIADAAFDGRGCAISQASASLMTEILPGKTREEALALFRALHELCTKEHYDVAAHADADPEAMERLAVLSGVREFPMRVKCATLAWHTMKAALAGEGKATTE